MIEARRVMEKRETGREILLVACAALLLNYHMYGKFRAAARLLSRLHENQSIITKQGSSYRRAFNH